MTIIPDYVKDIYGTKCKWKNQICDGLCNNCYAITNGKICTDGLRGYKTSPYNAYNCSYPDYEDAILARQEENGVYDI